MPKRIRKIEYDRIDRVPSGAQPGAHVTLVKARRVKLDKLIDPASIDAKVQAVRDGFREQYSNNYGCCSPCSGYVYVDAVYDEFVIAMDSDGDYWRFGYTLDDASMDPTFDTPTAVMPTVSWAPDLDADDDDAPTPVMKARQLFRPDAAERATRVVKWTDNTKNRKALAAMDPPQALSDGSYPMPNSDYVTKAIDALGRAGSKRGQVLKLIRARASALGMDLSGSSVKELQTVKKGTTMPPTATAELDLSALDDETREAVEAAVAERDELKAAAAETPEPEGESEDLDTVEGLQKAIKKSKSPENKALLTAVLKRVEKAEKEHAENTETVTRLQKAERVRLFKERAQVLGHMAPHAAVAATDDVAAVDGTDSLAVILEKIDATAGSDTAEAVERILSKAHAQVHELLDKKGLLKSVGRTEGSGQGQALATVGDPEGELTAAAAELRKSNPEMSEAQARTRVLKARPDLYAASISQ